MRRVHLMLPFQVGLSMTPLNFAVGFRLRTKIRKYRVPVALPEYPNLRIRLDDIVLAGRRIHFKADILRGFVRTAPVPHPDFMFPWQQFHNGRRENTDRKSV